MKKHLLFLTILSCLVPLVSEAKPKRDKLEDVYDLTVPFSNEQFCDRYGVVIVNGDLPSGRVPMFPVPCAKDGDPSTDPLLEKRADGTLVIPEEISCPTSYCAAGYVGGEDVRAFHLEGIFGIKKGEWRRVVVEFTPRRDGKVSFAIDHWVHRRYQGQEEDDLNDAQAIAEQRIPYKYCDLRFVRYAKFWTENTVFRDPGTSKIKPWCAYGGTRLRGAFANKIKPTIVLEKEGPVKKSIRVSNDIHQVIPVKANQKVIIVFYACGDDYFLAKWVDWDPKAEKKEAEKKSRKGKRRR